jgi:hypothetical protein
VDAKGSKKSSDCGGNVPVAQDSSTFFTVCRDAIAARLWKECRALAAPGTVLFGIACQTQLKLKNRNFG